MVGQEVLLGGVLLMLVPGCSLVRKLSHKAPHTPSPTIAPTPHSSTSVAGPLNIARTLFNAKQSHFCGDKKEKRDEPSFLH